jgi:uncharacterized protein
MILLSILVGMVTGIVNATAGGGGLLSLPFILALGVNPVIAMGTNKFQSTIGALTSITYFRKKNLISFRYAFYSVVFAFIGAVFGVYTVKSISSSFLEKLIPVMLLLILCVFIFNKKLGVKTSQPKIKTVLCFIIFGIILGFYDGFFGPGTGNFWVFALVGLAGFDFRKATAYGSLANASSNMASFILFTAYGFVNFKIALPMAAGQIIGSIIGAKIVVKKSPDLIRKIFLFIVFVVTMLIFYKYYCK